MSALDFWQNRENAQKISQQSNQLKNEVEEWETLKKELDDLSQLSKISQDDKELKKEISIKFKELKQKFNSLEFFVLFKGKYDKNNAILSIHAGTGGVDAQDWAEMLQRMYLRFCEQKDWQTQIIDLTRGNEAGIKKTSIEIIGNYAYGFLKAEAGVHRLVRISPFDAEKMRHTSFALVEILPELKEISEIEIKDEDLKIETSTAQGHGGQGVNTTYSAIKIIHLPSKITVSCQNERSQTQNKETALKILRAKLLKHYQEKQQEKKDRIRGELLQAEWGNQIRSYVLQPYKLVKDHRTGYESKEPDKVLNGKIWDFIEAYLKQKS